MSSDFFITKEDSEAYDTVCDIRKKKDRINTNVINAFSGLKCPGTELHEWESDKSDYIRKFKKAKQCVQRRLTKMKDFSAITKTNKTSRRKHIYPIKVAYSYGKDCLKKFATHAEQNLFKNSTDELINKISKKHSNIKGYFSDSIEKSIKQRGSTNNIRSILEETYYNKDKQNIIDKQRILGYNALNNDDKEKFYSIYNEGFSRNKRYGYNNEEEPEIIENINTNFEILKPSKTLKKNFRKRQNTKRKPKSIGISNINISKLNEIISSDKLKITNEHILEQIKSNKEELYKLNIERIYIDKKLFMLEDIFYTASKKTNKFNINIYEALSKISGPKISVKSIKKLGLGEKDLYKYKAVETRKKIYEDISITHKHLKNKLNDIIIKIKKIILLPSNNPISRTIQEFYVYDLLKYTLKKTNEEISSLSDTKLNELKIQATYLTSLPKIVENISNDLTAIEEQLNINLQELENTQLRLNNVSDKKLKTPEIRKLFENKVKKLKEDNTILEKSILDKYIDKTNKLRNVLQEINNNYVNIIILENTILKDIKASNYINSNKL